MRFWDLWADDGAYHGTGPDTEGDEKLVRGDENTTDGLWCGLSLVHGNDDGKSANTDTLDETADGELSPVAGGGDFDQGTDHAEKGRGRDGVTTTNQVGQLTGDQGADERTSAEVGSDGTLADGGEAASARGIGLTETVTVIGHVEETGDLSGGVSEHETTNRGDETQEPGDEGSSADWLERELRVVALLERRGILSLLLGALSPENHVDICIA